MDPNAALIELRGLMKEASDEPLGVGPGDLERMAELFESLDNWLSKGGFLPAAWERPKVPRGDFGPF